MKSDLFLQQEATRSEIYKLLAECFYPPDENLFEKIIGLNDKFKLVGLQDIDWNVEKMLRADSIKDLTVEHARLFVGPYTVPAPPYGSVYMEPERRIMGNSTMDVIQRYRQFGLVVGEDFKDAPDHIAAELEFMHFLCFKAMEAAHRGDADQVAESLTEQQSFLQIHLGAWIPEFAGKVIENASTSFYRNLAGATETFIKKDYHVPTSFLNSWSSNPAKSAEIESSCGQC